MRPSGRRKLTAAAAGAAPTNATSMNWSGAAHFAGNGTTYGWVAGQWTVPNPYAPGTGSFYCSQWVGIDGWGSGDVLQAGTETEIVKVLWLDLPVVYTWWEWYPAGEVAISNLPVSPGDVMYCLICAGSTTTATVTFNNQSSNTGTRFDITAPQGSNLVGNVAEWVVERPGLNNQLTSLTDFDVVYFDGCLAGWHGRDTLGVDDLNGASAITMTGTGGATLAVPAVENEHLMKVVWRAAN